MSLQLSRQSLQTLRIESNNHLYFAHWELFRVGILTIFNQGDERTKTDIVRMLKTIYNSPRNYSFGSKSVPTPYHMQWLCAKLLEELHAGENHLEDADFKLLLLRILHFADDGFVQNIYNLFWSTESTNLSTGSLKDYSILVDSNPQLAAELVECLLTRKISLPHFLMAEVLLNYLRDALQFVRKDDDNLPEPAASSLHTIGFFGPLVTNDKSCGEFEPLCEKLQVCIDEIIALLKDIGQFNYQLKTQIFFLLLPKQNIWLLKKMHLKQCAAESEMFSNDVFLSRVFDANMELNIKELCLETLETNSHFLERILECCLYLVETGKLDIVLDILKPALLHRLWPLVYILSWENVRTLDQIQSLLNHSPIVSSVHSEFDPLLIKGCRNASRNATLAVWCIQNRFDPKGGDDDAKIVEILQDLSVHSPLFVINKFLGLNYLDKSVIIAALNEHSNYGVGNGKDKVTLLLPNDYLYILNGYYIIKNIVEALCSGQELDYLLREKCRCKLNVENQNLDDFYETRIGTKLKDVQSSISDVFPLPFRIQLLEDAFSLLFLQNRHLEIDNDECAILSDEGSEGEDNSEKKNENSSSVQTSSLTSTASNSNVLPVFQNNGKGPKNKKFTRRTRATSSATTTTSSCSSQKDFRCYGKDFTCSSFLARDLLFILKEAILEVEISVRKHHNIEIFQDVARRITRLSKFISDAIWKLHMVTNENWLDPEAFMFSSDKFCRYFTEMYPDTKCIVPIVFQVVVLDGSSTDDESRVVVRRCGRLLTPQQDTSVIRMMLSSQESLVYTCLRRNQLNLVKAEQAIKMFNLRDSDCAREVRFMASYKKAIQQLCTTTGDQSENASESRTLKVISLPLQQGQQEPPMRKLSQVAGEAIKAALSPEVMIVDELLGMRPVPYPIMSDAEFQNEDIEDNFAKALVISDLVTVSTCDINSSLKLFNLAKERLPKPQKGNKAGDIIHAKMLAFFRKMTQLAETQMQVSSTNPCFGSFNSMNELITSWCWSIEPAKFQRLSNISSKMRVLENCRQMTLNKSSVSRDENAFDVLVCEVNEMAVELAAEFIFERMQPKVERREAVKVPIYLKMILDYVNSIKSLLGKCEATKQDEEDLELGSSLALLRLPQKEIIKKLMQNPELTSDQLQEFAKQSKLDLAALITHQCTPKINVIMEEVFTNNGTWKNGHFVLNEFSPCDKDPIIKHPEVIVCEILKDIIILMKGLIDEFGNSNSAFLGKMALKFCQSPCCWKVLSRTQELCHVDLMSVRSTNQQMAFFTNIVNLLTLHALMVQFQEVASPSLLSSNVVVRMAAENQFAYRIGQLGIVSLMDLRQRIRKSSLDCASTFHFGDLESCEVDPRLIFAVSNGAAHSPKLQVLYADQIDEQLGTIFHEYLKCNIKICMQKPEITIPQLIIDHIDDFVSQTDDKIAHFLTSSIVPEEIAQDVAELQKTHIVSNLIHIEPFDYKFRYIFDYNSCDFTEANEDVSNVQPCSELQCPSEAVLHYLEASCPLAATLTNLLQDSGVELVKLQNEFPFLHRFLQQRIETAGDFYRKQDVQKAFCSKTALHCAWLSFDGLTETSQVDVVLRQLETTIAIGYWRQDNVVFIQDVVYESIVLSLENVCEGDNCPWNLASRIRDETRRARCVLKSYRKWPPDAAIKSLTLCRNLPNIPKYLRSNLSVVLTKLTLYEKVCSLVKNGEVDLPSCSTWILVEQAWRESADQIFNAFFVARKFQFVVDWADSHKIPETLKRLVEECRVLAILGESIVDPVIVKNIADSIPEPFLVCDIFLQIMPNVKHLEVQLHIANLLLEDDTTCSSLAETDRHKIWERKIAIQVMLCVPNEERKDYKIFLNFPLAFIEQLLINMKMEILQKAILAIHDDIASCLSESRKISSGAINSVLEIYAEKAIDFKVVYRKPLAAKSASNFVANQNPSKAYTKPAVPPKKEDWVPDSEVTKCMVCKLEPFSMFNRRHHCRRCGRVVCATCSQNRAIVKGYQEVLVRVCDECVETSSSQDNETASRSPSLSRFRLMTESNCADVDQSVVDEEVTSELQVKPLTKLLPARRVLWQLSGNHSHDATLREEFFYEQAPSVPLCLSILDLHSDQGKCATFSLGLVRNIFQLLQPIGPGTANSEIDYSLTISMALSMLLNAKVNFSKACLWDQVNECDSLLGLADIFKLLVAANCHHLMPYGDLDDPDVLRRLRDRLMEEERWKVALEVSTKSGQDVDSVLVTWAMFCLRSGQLDAAREKFSRCLRKSHEGYHATLNNLTLPKILTCLDGLTTKSAKVHNLQARLEHIKSGNLFSNAVCSNDGLCESLIWNESLYYLNMYGTHKQFLHFYIRKQRLDLALQHILDKKCDLTIFLDGIWKPMVESGKMTILLNSLVKRDRSLTVWSTYISGLCGFLERRKHWNQLYHVQKFCDDHIRAAFTCIHFYKDTSRTYLELYDRLQHLANARHHFEQYMSAKTDLSPVRMQMPRQSIHRHISSIELQVQVTKFLERNWNNTKRLMTVIQDPPTVFDNNAVRALLAAQVLLAGSRIEDGFGIAYRIIQEFRLKEDKVYCLCAKKLVQHGRLEHVHQIIDAIRQSANVDANMCDSILMTALDEAIILKTELQQLEPILKLLTGQSSKIQAFIRCGKLKSAYLLAVKCGSAADIQLICSEATRLQQTSLQNICHKWLIAHKSNP